MYSNLAMIRLLFLVLLSVLNASAQQVPLDRGSPPAAALFDAGTESFLRKDFANAAGSFSRLCREYPSSAFCARARQHLATSYFLSSRYEDAIAALESLPEPERASNEALHMIAMSHIFLGQGDAARVALARLHGLTADSAEAKLLTARMMIRAEREGEAEVILKSLLASGSPPPGTYYYYGILLLAGSQVDEAIKTLSREVIVNPTNSDTYYKLGDAFGRKQDWSSAIRYLQLSIWLNPDQSGPYILLGKAYLATGDLTNAEGMLRRAAAMDPNSTAALYALAQVLTRSGRASEAKLIFDQVRRSQQDAGH